MRQALFDLAHGRAKFEEPLRTLAQVLGVNEDHWVKDMPVDWREDSGLVTTYLTCLGRVGWNDQERNELGSSLLQCWGGQSLARQPLTHALLMLKDVRDGQALAELMAKDRPTEPDPLSYQAIAHALESQNKHAGSPARSVAIRSAEDLLWRTNAMKRTFGKGPRPGLCAWAHRELAKVTSGGRRRLHLLSAELSRESPLRPYEQVINGDYPPGVS